MSSFSLSFEHPRPRFESLPERTWDARRKLWIFGPTSIEAIAAEWEAYLLGQLVGHALRLVNLEWSLDDVDQDSLRLALVRHAISAGRRVGVTFTPGRARPRHVLDGDCSLEWLERAAARSAAFALEVWDPNKADEIKKSAAKGGRASRRGPRFTLADLERVARESISRQAELLGCSVATVSRLRRQAVTA